jgi:diamine N-acetyltransferase
MIKLRKIEPSDLPFLYQWENDATMWADSDTHNPLSRHDLHQYIENTTGDIYRDGQLRLIIEDSQLSNKIVGCIDLFDFDARNRKAAIGMYISPEARGKGVGKQAVQLLEDYAFGFLHLRMLYAIISVHNTPCSHVYEQMGYSPSSLLKDWTLEGDAILWQKCSSVV